MLLLLPCCNNKLRTCFPLYPIQQRACRGGYDDSSQNLRWQMTLTSSLAFECFDMTSNKLHDELTTSSCMMIAVSVFYSNSK